jgi:hypothetical protein
MGNAAALSCSTWIEEHSVPQALKRETSEPAAILELRVVGGRGAARLCPINKIVRHRHSIAVVSCSVLFRLGLSIVERAFYPSPSKILAERRGAGPAVRNRSSWKSKEA